MKKKIAEIKRKIALVLYGCLFLLLISSELINSFFNNRFDGEEVGNWARIIISFKPLVIIMYFIFTSILYYLILHYLSPLFKFYTVKFSNRAEKEKIYGLARKAAISMPRMVIIFQVSVWVLATIVYYTMRNWQVESGIPFIFGLLLKVSSGVLGALYSVFLINNLLIDLKNNLKIVDIRSGEMDTFTRRKDYFAIIGSSFYIFVQMSYIGWYYSQSQITPDLIVFTLPVFTVGLFLFLVGIGPTFLSRREYRIQVKTLLKEMDQINDERADLILDPIYLTNFDELGDLAVTTNKVVAKFTKILEKVLSAVEQLSSSAENLLSDSQANASATNEQAAAVAEVVATMEDSNRLSKHMGDVAEEVKNFSEDNLLKVNNGLNTLKQYLDTMEQLKDSNNRSIDFVYSLNENIKTIMDVSAIIKSIADQVKIIAFNAELEASAAGEAGKNFEIVASEVRRLADNTVTAATEIREKINFIEKESKQLYNASRETTQLIEKGWNLSQETESSFQVIENTSTKTSESAKSISGNIQIQIQGFEQILLTMKEIATTSKEVSSRTKTTAGTANDLESLIKSLRELTT